MTEKPQGRTVKFQIWATLFTQSHGSELSLEPLSKHGQWFNSFTSSTKSSNKHAEASPPAIFFYGIQSVNIESKVVKANSDIPTFHLDT